MLFETEVEMPDIELIRNDTVIYGRFASIRAKNCYLILFPIHV